MIRDQNIPNVGLEEMIIYQNIRRLAITKATVRLDLVPCSEVLGCILPQTNPTSRIISDIKGEDFASFTDYKLPLAQVMMTEDWIKGINIDPLEYAKKMVVPKKQLRKKASREYEY